MTLAQISAESALGLARSLIQFDSVSSTSNESVSRWVADRLTGLGFEIEWLTYLDSHGVLKVNVVARRNPTKPGDGKRVGADEGYSREATSGRSFGDGGVCYLAHTDVVPADDWSLDFCGPFQPIVRDDRLWGRGSCDMKGSLACAIAAVAAIPVAQQTAPIYFVVTADEEVGMDGAKCVEKSSLFFQEMVDRNVVGVVGEPTELKVVHAHKGGASMRIVARGKSAHSSTRDGINANHQLIPILPFLLDLRNECESNVLLHNHDFDPPTLSWNMVLRNEPFATNVTPSLAEVVVFLRCMPGVDHLSLMKRVEKEAAKLGLEFYQREGLPFRVERDAPHIREMLVMTEEKAPITVCYATDAGVLQRLSQLVICGPGSIEQAHRSDEYISLEQLNRGAALYEKAFRRWATSNEFARASEAST
jgi:acetylornithine deacetylase